MFRRLGPVVAIVAVAPFLSVPAAGAAGESYVALGDSYSSGTGTGEYIDDGTSCQRSVHAYASLIAAAKGYQLNLRACGGAKVPDVTSGQLSALSASTTYVTISVGGNDAGFSDVLIECALPAWASNCSGAVDTARDYINNTLPASLSTLYADIRSKAPNAKVVTVGYPRIFNGEDCNAATFFSPDDESRLNGAADLINAKTSEVSSAAGFEFVSPTDVFVGHAVCDDPEWLNGLSNPTSESYHPNRTGHASGYTPLVSGPLTASAVVATPAVAARAASLSEAQADLQRKYAVSDSKIQPTRFVIPDLSSAKVRAAARKAGVDLSSRASIERTDREYARAQAKANPVR